MATVLLVIRLSRIYYLPELRELHELICLDSYLCREDVIKSKLVYIVLMRPKIRPKHVSAATQRHVKTILSLLIVCF